MSRTPLFKGILTGGLVLLLVTACRALPVTPPPSPARALQATATSPPLRPVPITTPAPEPASPTSNPLPTETPVPAPQVPGPEVPAETVLFAVIGDYGEAGPALEAVAALVKSWNPDLIITTGDNNYPRGSAKTIDQNIGQYFHEFIAPYAGEYGTGAEINRFFPVLGNHDWMSKRAQPYLDYFELPGNERYYDFTWGPVHFFALDSAPDEPDGISATSLQGQWLQAGLAASTAPWNIVYFHHPPFSSARHGSNEWMRWPFKEWGADAVLAGHDHVYERIIIDEMLYFTNGLGGNPSRYNFVSPLEGSVVRFREAHGAMRVEAGESRIRFEFFTTEGTRVDEFTIERIASAEEPVHVGTFPDPAAYRWSPVVQGFTRPLLVTHAGDGSGRLFVVEQPGTIRIVQGGAVLPEPFLDLRPRVGEQENEQGLLGLAFHPQFAANGLFFVDYTDRRGDTVVARFQVSPGVPNRADPDSAVEILTVSQPFANHNGGHLAFGPDGFLYVSLGDGGAAGDPQGNAQNPDSLLGSLLRLDVDSDSPYAIPAGNPFAAGGGRPEIWAWGLRNPWRFAFDRLTGDLFIGDVGQDAWEEIDFLPAGSAGGANFGWDYLEGSHPYEGAAPAGISLTSPIAEYSHPEGGCSVTGGVVYRGAQLPGFQGVYLYGDYCTGLVWGLLPDDAGGWQVALLFETGKLITSFGEDESGEVYLVSRQGSVFRLEAK